MFAKTRAYRDISNAAALTRSERFIKSLENARGIEFSNR